MNLILKNLARLCTVPLFYSSSYSADSEHLLTTYFDGTKVLSEKFGNFLTEQTPEQNTLFCPLGPDQLLQTLHQALNIEGITNDSIAQKEIEELIGHSIVAQAVATFNKEIPAECHEEDFTFSNHQYIFPSHTGVNFKAIEQLSHLGSAIVPLNFSNPHDAANKINSIIERDTHSLIKDLAQSKQFDSLTRAVFLSTLYVKANWTKAFRETQMLFKTTNEEKTIRGLTGPQDVFYAENDQDIMVTLKACNKLYLLLKMSKLGGVSPITAADFDYLSRGIRINLTIPEFTIENTVDLLALLKDKLPSSLSAEFMTSFCESPLEISVFLQKNKIAVTKDGLEGASATVMSLRCKSMPPRAEKDLTIDRPFSFLLSWGIGINPETGGSKNFLHLLGGNVWDPEEK